MGQSQNEEEPKIHRTPHPMIVAASPKRLARDTPMRGQIKAPMFAMVIYAAV